MNDTTPCRMLDWDSRFFGVRIARVESQRLTPQSALGVVEWCREQQVDCLYFLCVPDDDESVRQAEGQGFHLVDVRVELDWRAQQTEAAPFVRGFQERDLPELQQLAAEVYTDTRFYFDTHFSAAQASSLYCEWMTKSCRGEADAVFIAPHADGVGGFITCHLETPSLGRIGLVGVKPEGRGGGYGRALVNAAQAFFHKRGVAEVRVVTQGRNLAAQRLYQSKGFRTRSVNLWYHKWF